MRGILVLMGINLFRINNTGGKKMNRRLRMIAVLAAFVALIVPSFAEDKILMQKKGADGKLTKSLVRGTITKDTVKGMVVKKAELTIPIKRTEIVKFKYDAAPAELNAMEKAIADEDFRTAARYIKGAVGKGRSIDPAQRNMIMQHVYYNLGLIMQNLGKYDQAKKAFGLVISSVPDSAYYYQAKLGEAEVMEESGDLAAAANRFKLLVADFKKVASDNKLSREQAGPYVLLAMLGDLRLQVKKINTLKDADSRKKRLDPIDAELDAAVRKYPLNAKCKEVARFVKGLIWQGQERWDKLVTFLDKVILDSQLKDKTDRLPEYYKQRGDANFSNEEYRAAVLDYMRLWLEFNIVTGQTGAEVQYRIGKCLTMIKDTDWKKRAKKHFAISKSIGAEPFSSMSSKAIKALTPKKKKGKK
jgi:tetratricopeptide (TPR) repeat protein